MLLALIYCLSLFAPPAGTIALAQTADQVGEWGSVLDWGIQGKHMVQLPNGKVLVWSTGDNARVWDPATGAFTQTPALFGDLHCAAQATLADGRVIVIGGQDGTIHNGISITALFDPFTNSWTQGTSMADPRWYPTATTLADGRVLATSGDRPDGTRATIPEVYDPLLNSWTQLPAANREQGLYPLMYVLPDGRLYEAGTSTRTYFLNLASQTWSNGPINGFGSSSYAESSAMYAPGKIIRAGGGDPSIARAAVIDMNIPAARWREISAMAFPRRRHTLTLLADGTVMAVGGTRQGDYENMAVLPAEIWDPVTEQWTETAAMSEARMYHASSLLLPDGRVLTAGGETTGRLHAQIFSPPYLFKGPRPTISSSPSNAPYGSDFIIGTPDAATITTVALIRAAAVTHAFDHNQRYVPLTFTASAGGLLAAAPADGNIAPPGYYMLVIKNAAGVPSVAKWVRVDTGTNLAPGTISGRVTDRDTGTGIANATISYGEGTTTTDVNGDYTLADVPSGEQSVTVVASGYAPATKSKVVPGSGAITLDFTLAVPGTITGQVTSGETGNPIEGATITYNGGAATTDAGGLYTIANIASGDEVITASATGYQSSPARTVGVPANGSVAADFVLNPKPMYITGELIDRVTTLPIIGATVSYGGGSTTTDGLGRYTLSNTPPGTHTVVVSATDYISASQEVVVTFGAYTTKDFTLDSAGVPASVFTPVADAYTDTLNPTTNYGGGQKLVLDKDASSPLYNSYLRFNVSGLTGQVLNAKLRLYVSNGGDHGGTIHSVANTYLGNATPWAETGVTWNNAPAIGAVPLSSQGAVGLSTWVEFDVTPALAGNGTYSFGLKAASTDKVEYGSRESPNQPQLIIRQSASSPLAISGFAPSSGPVGTEVTIDGVSFSGVAAVTFNDQLATNVVIDSDTRIRAVVPSGATSGKIRVTTATETAASLDNFVVTVTPTPTPGPAAPVITGFAPTSGPVGTEVTISGTGFSGATAVTFNGLPAGTFVVESGTQIRAVVPSGATSGKLRVTTAAGTAATIADFVVSVTPQETEHYWTYLPLVMGGQANGTASSQSQVPTFKAMGASGGSAFVCKLN